MLKTFEEGRWSLSRYRFETDFVSAVIDRWLQLVKDRRNDRFRLTLKNEQLLWHILRSKHIFKIVTLMLHKLLIVNHQRMLPMHISIEFSLNERTKSEMVDVWKFHLTVQALIQIRQFQYVNGKNVMHALVVLGFENQFVRHFPLPT